MATGTTVSRGRQCCCLCALLGVFFHCVTHTLDTSSSAFTHRKSPLYYYCAPPREQQSPFLSHKPQSGVERCLLWETTSASIPSSMPHCCCWSPQSLTSRAVFSTELAKFRVQDSVEWHLQPSLMDVPPAPLVGWGALCF